MSESTVIQLVSEIKNKKSGLESTQILFKDKGLEIEFDKFNKDHWSHFAFNDSIIKLILMTEKNFNEIETFGLVSTARYIFELSIRLTLIAQDSLYGLAYYGQLLRDKIGYWKSLEEQLKREIILLNQIEEDENELQRVKLIEYSNIEDPILKEKIGATFAYDIMSAIDNKASRKFSIHAEQAKANGYGFRASLIEKNQLSIATSSLAVVESEYAHFCSSVPHEVLLNVKRWKWKDKAKATNHLDEYDYIYSFTSSMLHATPANITTKYKLLSNNEMIIFLKYINVKLMDINELANEFISTSSRA